MASIQQRQPEQRPQSPALRLVQDISTSLVREEPPCRAASPQTKALGTRIAGSHRFVPAGSALYFEGDQGGDLYVVLDGWMIQYQILSDGCRQILEFALPGAILGCVSPSKPTLNHSVESLTGATVAVIPRARVLELCRSDPEFSLHLISAGAASLNLAFESITDIGRRTAREAVAHVLLRLYTRVRAQCPRSTEASVMLPLTQTHIGDACGLTSVHVCRTLSKLRKDGIVSLRDGTLHVLDLDALRRDSMANWANAPGIDRHHPVDQARARPIRLAS